MLSFGTHFDVRTHITLTIVVYLKSKYFVIFIHLFFEADNLNSGSLPWKSIFCNIYLLVFWSRQSELLEFTFIINTDTIFIHKFFIDFDADNSNFGSVRLKSISL